MCDEFQLPQEGRRTGYQGILWHAFYGPGDIGTEAKIINEDFALVLAQGLSPYHQTKAAALLGSDLQSWVELGTLRRTFRWWIDKSVHKGGKTYQAVKKCEQETTNYGRRLLEEYESRMNGDKAGDKTIAQLRINLFLDLCVGKEVNLVIGGHGMVKESEQPARSRLEWWIQIDEQSVQLELRDMVGAGPNQQRLIAINTTGAIISELGGLQGIFFHEKTVSLFVIAEQSREDQSLTAERSSPDHNGPHGTGPTQKISKRHYGHRITSSSYQRKDDPKYRSKIKRRQKSTQGKTPFQGKATQQ
jgi:hypothetical protein